MIFKLIFIFLCIALTLSQTFLTFDQYVTQFKKEYNASELITRAAIYANNIKIMETITDYTPKVNEFTDWTDAEIAKLSGLLEKSGNNTDSETKDAVSGNRVGAPSSFDWKTQDGVTSVKNQGQCGSCWAFAAVAYAESKMLIDGRYSSIDLSEQMVLECTSDSSCNGGYLESGFNTLLKKVPFELLAPYDPSSTGGGNICSIPGVQIGEQVEIYNDLLDSELIELVVERPVAIAVSATNWQYYGSGVFKCSPTDPINHAVLLVGYTPEYWIIKNSWGSDWGEDGYIRVSRSLLSNCRIGSSAARTFEWRLGAVIGLFLSVLLVILFTFDMFID